MDVQVDNRPMRSRVNPRASVFRAVSVCKRLCSPLSTPSPPPPPPLATTTTPAAPSATAIDSVNLSSALTALKVSLKRDLDSFAPPTPAVSPVHGRSAAKRTCFGFDERATLDAQDVAKSGRTAAAATTAPQTVNALLAVSTRIKFELEKRRRCARAPKPEPRRRQQLSYFAIVGAFQRAAHERKVAMQLEYVVETSTE
ncbi:unnamed protein product [Hyaloperonospora brassicae]|uniref:RxLR effector candidate protein n=1 Tax=Hyaloperonospora brassicae TaxID=162125 RepID=A0AAV0UYT1_HYABA|nr:unnamed protein product [Hyaloperonospora brassicae]